MNESGTSETTKKYIESKDDWWKLIIILTINYSKTGSNFPSDADMKGKYKEAAEI